MWLEGLGWFPTDLGFDKRLDPSPFRICRALGISVDAIDLILAMDGLKNPWLGLCTLLAVIVDAFREAC